MKIIVSTSFLGIITQNKLSVKTVDEFRSIEYSGTYHAGEWEFKLFNNENKIVLESKREKLPKKQTFLGRQQYTLLWEGREMASVKKSYFKREVVHNEKHLPFPGLFKRSIPEIGLKFPISALLYRRKVKSYCSSKEIEDIMLSIAMTIFTWFTWNAIPAD